MTKVECGRDDGVCAAIDVVDWISIDDTNLESMIEELKKLNSALDRNKGEIFLLESRIGRQENQLTEHERDLSKLRISGQLCETCPHK